MNDTRFLSLPVAASLAIVMTVCMPLLARFQPKPEDGYWNRVWPKTYPTIGRVLYEGVPVVEATVMFHTTVEETGYSYQATGFTDKEGFFWLRTFDDENGLGAAAGRHHITIQKMVPTGQTVPGSEGMGFLEFGGYDEIPEMVSAVPERFSNPETSGLFATVTANRSNELVIRLTKEPPPEVAAGLAERASRSSDLPPTERMESEGDVARSGGVSGGT